MAVSAKRFNTFRVSNLLEPQSGVRGFTSPTRPVGGSVSVDVMKLDDNKVGLSAVNAPSSIVFKRGDLKRFVSLSGFSLLYLRILLVFILISLPSLFFAAFAARVSILWFVLTAIGAQSKFFSFRSIAFHKNSLMIQ